MLFWVFLLPLSSSTDTKVLTQLLHQQPHCQKVIDFRAYETKSVGKAKEYPSTFTVITFPLKQWAAFSSGHTCERLNPRLLRRQLLLMVLVRIRNADKTEAEWLWLSPEVVLELCCPSELFV